MTDILVINGPNLNMFGVRETEVYGADTLVDYEAKIAALCKEIVNPVVFFQSNHEGELVTAIQNAANMHWDCGCR